MRWIKHDIMDDFRDSRRRVLAHFRNKKKQKFTNHVLYEVHAYTVDAMQVVKICASSERQAFQFCLSNT
jgi:hypothetical protein